MSEQNSSQPNWKNMLNGMIKNKDINPQTLRNIIATATKAGVNDIRQQIEDAFKKAGIPKLVKRLEDFAAFFESKNKKIVKTKLKEYFYPTDRV